jgi:hypothetical protein
MKNPILIKAVVIVIGLAVSFLGFSFGRKSEMRSMDPAPTPTPAPAAEREPATEIRGYRQWAIASKDRFKMDPQTAQLCAAPVIPESTRGSDIESSPHKDHYINVFVNSVGRSEMFTKKNPRFPVGTVIVKEKLAAPDSTSPELLTVMIKRKKGFNPDFGNWEFMTVTGDGNYVTARGKLESCQKCHADYPTNDYVTRLYLDGSVKARLK